MIFLYDFVDDCCTSCVSCVYVVVVIVNILCVIVYDCERVVSGCVRRVYPLLF